MIDTKRAKIWIKQEILSKLGLYNKIYLYWWVPEIKNGLDNFGDILNKYLVSKITDKKIIHVYDPNIEKFSKYYKHFLAIGSVIRFANSNSHVWGSGIIDSKEIVSDSNFLAVRGPRTGKRLEELNLNNPKVYGDPAILLAKYYSSKVGKKFKFGIIPHYVDFDELKQKFNNFNDVNVINLMTCNVEKTIDEINEWELLVSSSLHGVIVAHSYNLPCLWVKFSNKLTGDDVKFFDYFESVEIAYKETFDFSQKDFTYNEMINLLNDNNKILLPKSEIFEFRKKELLRVCPF